MSHDHPHSHRRLGFGDVEHTHEHTHGSDEQDYNALHHHAPMQHNDVPDEVQASWPRPWES